MSSLSRAAGVGPTLELGGKKLTVNPRRLLDFGMFTAEVLSKRGNPLELVSDALRSQNHKTAEKYAEIKAKATDATEADAKRINAEADAFLKGAMILNEKSNDAMMRTAMNEAKSWSNVSMQEIGEWMLTTDGLMFISWRALKDNGPEFTREYVADLVMQEIIENGQEQVVQMIESAVNQASGTDLLGNSTGPQEQPTGASSNGDSSTEDLPKPTSGTPMPSTT